MVAFKQKFCSIIFLVTLLFFFQKLQQRMRERGEELGRRVKMQKTDVSFDVIYFFKKKIS